MNKKRGRRRRPWLHSSQFGEIAQLRNVGASNPVRGGKMHVAQNAGQEPDVVRLVGRTRKGANRVREAHAGMPEREGLWEVLARSQFVAFAPGRRGPWLLAAPLGVDATKRDRLSRWIHGAQDADFEVLAR